VLDSTGMVLLIAGTELVGYQYIVVKMHDFGFDCHLMTKSQLSVVITPFWLRW